MNLNWETDLISLCRRRKTHDGATVRQDSTLTEQRNILRSRIRAWDQVGPIYMPGLLQYQTVTLPTSSSPLSLPRTDNPEDYLLWVPSKIPTEYRATVCQKGLAEIEAKLCTAQCQDALKGIRNVLKMKTRMIAFKNRNIRGQSEGTRSRVVIDRVHERARNTAEKYRASGAAKLELEGHGIWEETLHELKDEDIRGYQDPIACTFDEAAVVFWKMKLLRHQETTLRQWTWMVMVYRYGLRKEHATMEPEKHVEPFHGYGRPHAQGMQTTPKTTSFVPSGQRAAPELHAHERKYSASKKR